MNTLFHKQHVELRERMRTLRGQRHTRTIGDRWRMLQKDARKRQIPFDVPETTLHRPCVYCGGEAVTLDRLDLSQGYVVNNVQPCCAVCFWMRGVAGDNLVDAVQSIVEKVPRNHTLHHQHKPKYFQQKAQLERKGVRWAISRSDWQRIAAESCYYCGHTPTHEQWNRPELLDTDGLFATDNVVSACKRCQLLREPISVQLFQEHISNMV